MADLSALAMDFSAHQSCTLMSFLSCIVVLCGIPPTPEKEPTI
jgi:hypothetical protein